MRRLLWIGSPFFCQALQFCGWRDVVLHNFEDARVFCWEDIVHLAGFVPDVLVVADKSRPPFVLGVENFPCLTVFYSVDAHIHSWQPYYAQGFDACLVSLRDYTGSFISPCLSAERIFWSPPFARDDDLPDFSVDRIWDCLFVGTVNANTPNRAIFLQELKKKLPGLHVAAGNYRELFPRGRVLLNHCENGDLNFRVFEAMGCGGSLVTPDVGHGLTDLFTDGEHLLTYSPDAVESALSKINFLLQHEDIADNMGKAALDRINTAHRARHRAQAFTEFLRGLSAQDASALIDARLARTEQIRKQYLKLPYLLWAGEMPTPDLGQAYLAAAKGCF
ncbi:MAG: glycosyltransferase [Desulfovibrio sp.]|jgi:glycosyltransferase involved in cell wall biosynthesis|nr:glycosyltransferase [Desulfovibrio sp.]